MLSNTVPQMEVNLDFSLKILFGKLQFLPLQFPCDHLFMNLVSIEPEFGIKDVDLLVSTQYLRIYLTLLFNAPFFCISGNC